MFCQNCGARLQDGQHFCSNCGAPAGSFANLSDQYSPSGQSDHPSLPYGRGAQPNGGQHQQAAPHSLVDSLNEYVGGESGQHVELNWRDLFRDVFRAHKAEDAEEIFVCGTPSTTPQIKDVSSQWPRPWLYSRVLVGFLIAFLILRISVEALPAGHGLNALPGMAVMGSFAVPLALMVMFMELNVYKNVSFYYVITTFLIGGCAALLVSLLLSEQLVSGQGMTYGVALCISIAEEVGKGLIVYYFLRRLKKPTTVLAGLLVGACVGAGFASFESLGYAIIQASDYRSIIKIIEIRGILAPGGHVAWAAITGAALCLANQHNGRLTSAVFNQKRFWKLFLIPLVCHFLWDSPLLATSETSIIIKYAVLIIAIWIFVLLLINLGLSEVSKAAAQQSEADNENPAQTTQQ